MVKPLRVGVLNDMSDGPPGQSDIQPWLRLAADDLVANGRIDREVEFVESWGLGLPSGTAAAVEHAFKDLVEMDPLIIVGPAIGDNALVATPLADSYRVPTINWAGTEMARSDYMFHLQVGSHEDEPILLARHLASLGRSRPAVVYDRSPIGRRYLQFFQAEAELLDVRISSAVPVAPLAEDADDVADQVLAGRPDAVVYLGLGVASPAVADALAARRFDGPRAMNSAGLRGYLPEFAEKIDGWTYIDMHSDSNPTLLSLRHRLGLPPGSGSGPARGYDLGRLVAEGLARAVELTREGVKDGLELVKWLPAAEGRAGTLLGFGQHDRGALHGEYLVLRRWVDGQTEEV